MILDGLLKNLIQSKSETSSLPLWSTPSRASESTVTATWGTEGKDLSLSTKSGVRANNITRLNKLESKVIDG